MADAGPGSEPREQQRRNTGDLPASFHRALLAAIGAPLLLAAATLALKWWPATLAIDWLDRADGSYPLRATFTLTFVVLACFELVVLVPLAVVVSAIRKLRRTGSTHTAPED